MKKLLFFFTVLLITFPSFAQQMRPLSSSEIYQKLGQLQTLGCVMYIAAHPDDENTRLLSYLVHKKHVRTIYLSLTRGDGGQNILGDEQGAALGLIRTHELLEARKIDGAEQLFSPVIDFGYTKSPKETFTFWDKKSLSRDVVAAIQKYKPDVLICRFPTTGEGGHGQHTASAFIAGWAYDYIQKNNENPKNKKMWLPKRLLFNSFHFGSTNTIKPNQFKLPINQYDPLLGEGYGEMAGRSRSVHRSQAAGTSKIVGIEQEHFQLIAGVPLETSLFDDVDLTWNRVGRNEIGTQIKKLIDSFDFTSPEKSLPDLVKIRGNIASMQNDFWRTQKLKEIDAIILSCAGIMTEIVCRQPAAIPGAIIDFSANIIARGKNIPVKLGEIEFPTTIIKNGNKPNLLQSDVLYKIPFQLKINPDEPLTQPYWMIHPPIHYRYQYDKSYGGLPEVNPLQAKVHFEILGTDISQSVPLSYKYLNPLRGDVVQRLFIIPALSIQPQNKLFVFEKGKNKSTILRIKTFEKINQAELHILNKDTILNSIQLGNLRGGLDTLISCSIPTLNLTEGKLSFEVISDEKTYNKARHLIQYTHIPELQYFTEASMKIVSKTWICALTKIGYVEGVGDYVDDILRLSGLNVESIPEKELNNQAYLNRYLAIIIGIRALNTQKALASGMEHLLRYVKDGGTLIVQYNKNRNLVTDQLGPYSFTISRDRVTDENAKVTVLNPKSSLLNYPNKITQKDFEGWVQERGVYFPTHLDKHYQTLFSMHDAGEKALKSAVLYTPYGKGNYIYTSLAFFRQLPAGNAGAIKLLMNFISAGRKPLSD